MKRQYNLMHTINFGYFVIMLLVIVSCESFIEIDPPKTEIVRQTVFTSDASAMSAARGVYSLMMSSQSFTNGALEEYTGMLADELISYSSRQEHQQFYHNALVATNGDVLGPFWREAYKYIGNANAMLEGLEQATGVSTTMQQHLQGEALFVRAFCHFYLMNLYGDVPYLTSSDYRINATAPRLSMDEVYEKIEADLLEARSQMVDDFSMANNERIQPNKDVATALLARLYLYRQEWQKAETEASALIARNTRYALNQLDDIFLKNSTEAIWQLQPVVPGSNTAQARLFVLTTPPNSYSKTVSLTQELSDAFEANDNRKTHWISTYTEGGSTWYYPYKYKVVSAATVTEYEMFFRLAEQYLIRAEARARQNNVEGAQQDLNIIRARAGLSDTDANDQTSLLAAIEQERRIELFAEGGHRWFDLNRTNRADVVLGSIKSEWQSDDALLPIPDAERQLNPSLSQNPNY